jgi:hypothetical protein
MGSTTQSEMTQRIAQVAEWLLVPYTSSEVVGLCRTEWGVGRSMAYEYIKGANELIAAEAKEDVAAEVRKAKSRYERFMRKAEDRNDLNVAVTAQDRLAKLLGIGAPEKTEVKHDVTDEFVGIFRGIVKATDKPA